MERYWDLTEKQRSELTDDQMESYYAIERMENGAIKPTPPAYEPDVLPTIATTRFYQVQAKNGYSNDKFNALFTSPEAAQVFIDTAPLYAESDWTLDYKETAKRCDGFNIVPMDIPTKDAMLAIKPEYKKAADAAERNKKMREEYEKAQTAYTDIVAKVTADRWECKELSRKRQRIVDTLAAYEATANGDKEIALKFLHKAFTSEDIAAAFAWFEMDVPECAGR